MRPAFLASAGARLSPLEEADDIELARAPWRFLSTRASGDVIALTALDEADRVVGGLRLEAIDWTAREATLALRWSAEPALAAGALRATLRYAQVDLRLERVLAWVPEADETWRALLVELGFAPRGRDLARTPTPVLLHDKAFTPSSA